MENLSHSLRRHKVSRMSSQANAAAKGIYDDVFGGPPKFGVPATLSPRAEDYREIFGGFHAPRVSSIPVLDLPVVDEKEVRFDVRSSGFDYSEVFGGLQDLDFADGYEELFGLQCGGSAGHGSSDEAWTAEASESHSEESDHSASNRCLSNEDSYHLFDGNVEYSISYNRANPRSDVEIANGLRCTAEIHAVPGYSYMVDHINPYQVKEKPLKKTRSDSSNCRNDVSRRKDYGRINSCPSETFVTISEVSLRTEPSHLPPPSRPPPAASMGDTKGPISSWKTGYAEGNGHEYCTSSPSFFDMEVDASSSAAAVASAAAMEEAMLKAQAQLRSAKELMERKKEGQQNRARTGSTGELRDMGAKHLNEDIVLSTSRGQSNEMKCFTVEEPRDVLGMGRAVQDSLGGEKLQNWPVKHFAERVRGKESPYNEMFGSSEEVGHWKETTQFSEMVEADRSGAVFAQTKGQDLSENVGTREDREKEGTIGWFEGQEKFNKMKATAERGVPNEECVADGRNLGPKVAKETSIENNIEIKEKAGQDTCLREDAKKTHRKTHHDRKAVVKLNGSESSDDHGSLNDVLIEVAREFEVRQVMEHKKDGLKSKSSSRRMEAKDYVTEGHGKACNEKRPKEPFKREEKERRPESVTGFMGNEKRCPGLSSRLEGEENRPRGNLESVWDDVNERQENEWTIKETLEREEKEKRMREVLDQQERKKLKEAQEREENERRVKANLELAENKRKQEAAAREEQERRLKDALELEENEKRLRKAREYAERRKLKEALECEENEKKLREACEQEDERRRKEAHEKKEKVLKEALEKEEKEKVLKALEKEEKEKMLKEALEREEGEKRLNESLEKEKMRKRLEEAQEMEENERKLRETHNRKHIEVRIPDAKGREKSENCHQEASQDEEDGSNPQYSYTDERNHDQGEIDDACRDTFELEELDKWLKEDVDVEEADVSHEAYKKFDCLNNDTENTRSDCPASGSEQSSDVTDASDVDSHLIRAESQGTGNELPVTKNKEEESKTGDSMESPPLVDPPKQTNLETPKAFSQMSCESKHQEEQVSAPELAKMRENINKCEACFDEDGKRVETPQPPALNAQRTSQQSQNASQETAKAQEKETERLKREQERLRKIEEEREREREREKDRMDIDRATLAARERAYAEARERADRTTAEKATAEARQRSLAEARERLEKACAEAREQSFLERTSNEARIRAERAAVERAIAEARERAASRYNGMRQSNASSDLRESQHRTAGSSSSTRFSYNVEMSEGVEGESPQRCRARLERHRRTAERAAKALAEKNMRDLLAQREQAERNRFAEILDADVKRWSSGKEGNLRALLSTLQYILGPDSGWQPIPLTEVITSAAVKRAYRKATLCVHPDKLQQRGASIQQKYTCEKVFDLLKEAWNKFNSEER